MLIIQRPQVEAGEAEGGDEVVLGSGEVAARGAEVRACAEWFGASDDGNGVDDRVCSILRA